MGAIAIIVGIDAYNDQPLTSAVRDALAFKDALLQFSLVDAGSMTLLTAPALDDGLLATRDEITAALRQPYLHGDDVDRMYVFFSGHGMLVPSSVSGSTSSTAFLPADVTDPIAEPWKLLNVDNLLQSFRTAGPREQFFVVDACRNLRYEQYPPELSPFGLSGRNQPAVGVRAQGALYAVSPGGQALGSRDGLGVMTSHLIQALHGAGEALDYDDALDSYVVTLHSVYAYIRARIEQQVSALPGWQRQYMLPDPLSSGPPLTPIRLVPDPGPASLTLTVEPPAAARDVIVFLLQRGTELAEPRWPPEVFGQPVPVPRQRFRLQAYSHGKTRIEPELIDARTTDRARITHDLGQYGPTPSSAAGPAAPSRDPGLGPATVRHGLSALFLPELAAIGAWHDRPCGWLKAAAEEPWAAVDIAGLGPPYREQSVRPWQGVLPEVLLPAGSYEVKFRVGSQAFSQTVAEVEERRLTVVRASAAASPLVASLTGATEHPSTVTFSEAVGPVQANPALSLVTLTALSRIRGAEGLLGFVPSAQAGVPRLSRSLSVAVAVDGTRWPVPADEIATGITAAIRGPGGQDRPVPLEALSAEAKLSLRPPVAGLGQIVTALVRIPWAGSTLTLRSAQAGAVELAVASVSGRTTSVGIVLRADGGIDVAQVITATRVDRTTAALQARRFLLGQWLYQSGELARYGLATEPEELRDVLTGEAVDPVLSAMAFYAWSSELAADGTGGPPGNPDAARFREQVGRRLTDAFPSNIDAVVIAALLDGTRRIQVRSMAQHGLMPVLAASTRAAAKMLNDPGAPLSAVAGQVAPDSLWTLRWTQLGEGS
jgi:Caspase domain